VSARLTWAEADRVAGQLELREWRIVRLLARLPLLWADPLQALLGDS
jgi:hypothetical protein